MRRVFYEGYLSAREIAEGMDLKPSVACRSLPFRLSFSEPDALQVLLIVENVPNHEQSLGREADEEDVPGMGVD